MTTLAQFQDWLDAPEGPQLEFKSATGGFHFDKLVDYCVAIANEGGGRIILGVTDRRPRQVVGTSAFAEPGRTEAGLHQRLGHRIPVEEFLYQNQRVLIVHVPSRLPGTAWNVNGRYLKRAGDDLATLGDAELRAMFAEAGPDFSAELCQAELADLAPEALAEFRNRWARKSNSPRLSLITDEQLLNDAELLVDDRLTYGALVLFGTCASLGRYLAQAEIIFEYRSFIRFLERLGEERLRHFSTHDFLALDAVCRDLPLTEAMRARIPGLIEAGAIEVQGRGRGVRHHLSQGLYAAIGQKGVYTRRKGLDHETNKALLMQHLAGNPDEGAPLSELCQVLPAQSTSSVQRLLRELRAQGRVTLQGSHRGARWYPAGVKGQDGEDL